MINLCLTNEDFGYILGLLMTISLCNNKAITKEEKERNNALLEKFKRFIPNND